jgi:hypothetical protein
MSCREASLGCQNAEKSDGLNVFKFSLSLSFYSLEPLPIAIPIQNRIDFNNRQDVNKPALDPHAKHN